jgi:hypothetical protein
MGADSSGKSLARPKYLRSSALIRGSKSSVCPRTSCALALRCDGFPIVGAGELRNPAPTSRILATSRTGTGIAYQSLRRSPTLFHTSKTIGVSPCVTSSWLSALVSSRSARFRPKRANRLVAADRSFTPGGPRSSCTGRFRRFGESTSIRGNFSGATASVPLLCGLDRTIQSASSLPNQRRVLFPTSRQLRSGST